MERRRNPYPHVYDAGREKWYVQRPDDVHMLREARLLRAPTQEVVPWQSWKYYHHLQNYLDGSYLSHQVYSFVFSTRALGGVADGGDARDAEDFKSAKLSLELRLNPGNPASRLFVYLQTFQTLQVRPDGRVTKACEYRDGRWHCGEPQRVGERQRVGEPSWRRGAPRRRGAEEGPRPEGPPRQEPPREGPTREELLVRGGVEPLVPPAAPLDDRVAPVPRFLQDDRAKAQDRMDAFTKRYQRGSADAVRSMWRFNK